MLALLRSALALLLTALAPLAASAYDVPKVKQTKLGKYLSAVEAAEMVKQERAKVLFLDVRTRAEIQFVGYTAEIDGVVPFVEMSQFGEWDDANSRYKLDNNPVFSQSVEKLVAGKGLGKGDRVILMCRSGDRSAKAVDLLQAAGFTNVYSVYDGFEGDLSPEGRRTVNGWRNAGLPWTYKLDKAKVYAPAN